MLLQSHTAHSGTKWPPSSWMSIPRAKWLWRGMERWGDCFEPQGLRITRAAFSPAEGGVSLENHFSGWQGKVARQRAG